MKDLAILLGENEVAIANEIADMEKEHITAYDKSGGIEGVLDEPLRAEITQFTSAISYVLNAAGH